MKLKVVALSSKKKRIIKKFKYLRLINKKYLVIKLYFATIYIVNDLTSFTQYIVNDAILFKKLKSLSID